MNQIRIYLKSLLEEAKKQIQGSVTSNSQIGSFAPILKKQEIKRDDSKCFALVTLGWETVEGQMRAKQCHCRIPAPTSKWGTVLPHP